MEAAKIPLSDLDAAVNEMAELSAQIDAYEEQIKGLNAQKAALQLKVIAALDATERKSYSTARARVTKVSRFQVSMPKDPESRAKFFDYLRERGVFENLVSVNYQTLNSFYKEQFEQAKDSGDIDFAIPGIGEARAFEYVTITNKA